MIDLSNYKPSEAKDWRYLDRFFTLLSEENLQVIRGSFRTASMDIKNRVIRIPHFAFENKDVALLMGSHEVAHALFTPDMWSHQSIDEKIKNRTLAMCLNIVEDIRIEKMIRRKYPGFAVIYRRGYKELLGKDFFSTNKWEEFNIADKVNAAAKLGKLCPHKLTVSEDCIRRYVSSAETSDDVVRLSLWLYKLIRLEQSGKKLEEMIKDLIEKLKNGEVEISDSGDGEGGEHELSGEGLPGDLQKQLEDAISDAMNPSDKDSSKSFDDIAGRSDAGLGKGRVNSKTEEKIDAEKGAASLRGHEVVASFCKDFKFSQVKRIRPRPA